MPSKQQLDKAAWEWANTTDPHNIEKIHIETAYRINLKQCKTICRRNCKGNPHCLYGLGEKNWMTESFEENWNEVEDPNNERKAEGSFVGLMNLGATCYVNSFLQVWFHNPNFRNAIYKWNPRDDPQEKNQFSPGALFKPVSCIGHLQLIFALLQYSERRYIDPTPFITMLGLSTTQQQDAQEFCQLLISLIEDKISYQSDPSVRSIIQQQYRGEYAYTTRCHKCSNESLRPSKFYELDLSIKGHKDLFECLNEFLKEEKLEGSNQYFCSYCMSKEDATRFIRLQTLPPVLHIQLLRFVFDRQTGCKKKLNSSIRFPEVLDMSEYLKQPEKTVVYEIAAVLIHRGPSAYSGHYVAHIKDRISGHWFKFNDENVEKMEGKKLVLGVEESLVEDSSVKQQPKAPRVAKGFHSSNTAYMLVYTLRNYERKSAMEALTAWVLPNHLKQAVNEDNAKFETWVNELAIMRKENFMTRKAIQNEITSLYEILPVKEGNDIEWISSSWLHKWLTNDSNNPVPPVDNSNALCPHEKLSPDKVDKMKCISKEGANAIYEKYGGGPRLSDVLCQKCVEARCHITRIKSRITDDQKKLASLLRVKIQGDVCGFWIGKHSLRNWRSLVLKQNEDLEEVQNESNCGDEVPEEEPILSNDIQQEVNSQSTEGNGEEEEDSKLLFNEDILCEHKNLRVEEGPRRLISGDAWNLLKQYFADAPEYKDGSAECSICKEHQEETKQEKDKNKQMAQDQKNILLDLYLDKNRPSAFIMKPGSVLHGLNFDFVDEWRRFLKDPTRRQPVRTVNNRSLICEHGGLPIHQDSLDKHLIWLWEYEWDVIQKLFLIDHEILLLKLDYKNSSAISTAPDLCKECLEVRELEESLRQLDYVNAKVFVRRVSKLVGGAESEVGEPDEAQFIEAQFNDSEKFDPDVSASKKVKLSEKDMNGGDSTLSWPEVKTNGECTARRSTRRRRLRGEKEFVVSSTDSLRDLKVQIMKQFSVAPYDQHLLLNGKPLSDNQATLASLRVVPGCIILLKADEIREEAIVMEDYLKVSTPETGFKGTGLLS